MDLKKLRNIGIMAHIDAGKTTTTERILFYTGKSYKMGEVDSGNATMDWMEQEQNRGITIVSAATTCFWNTTQINIIDTPGHVDFTAEVERSLRVLDGAITVLCSVKGIEAQTETVWLQADKYDIPRIVYVNKMDRVGADFFAVIEQLKNKFSVHPVPIAIPIGAEQSYKANIDLLRMEELYYNGKNGEELDFRSISSENLGLATKWRNRLLDSLSLFSDEIAELYLADEQPSLELIKAVLRQATIERKIVPVLVGSSLKNKGVQSLLDAVVDYLPSVADLKATKVHQAKKDFELAHSRTGVLAALVFKVQHSKDMGMLCYVRVYSGILKSGVSIGNIAKGKKERVLKILRMHADHYEQISIVETGDIAVLIGLKHSQTGDTLGSVAQPILLERPIFPEPVISIAIEPNSVAEFAKLQVALDNLKREDPTFMVNYNEDTGQTVISGMGELHLEILASRIKSEYRVDVHIGEPRVSYRESIGKALEYREAFKHCFAGEDSFVELAVRVEPINTSKPRVKNQIQVSAKTAGLAKNFLASLERGVQSCFAAGILLGYATINVLVDIQDIKWREEELNETAFESAAFSVVDKACRLADPLQLEPIMDVVILAPAENIGDVISHLSQKHGQIHSMESKLNYDIVNASVSLKNMFGYSTNLRSQTHGRGTFSMSFSHYSASE